MRWFILLFLVASCRPDPFAGARPLPPFQPDSGPVDTAEPDVDTDADADTDADTDADADGDCDFDYDQQFSLSPPPQAPAPAWVPRRRLDEHGAVAWVEPAPAGTWTLPLDRPAMPPPRPDLTMPSYSDDMPLFERADAWGGDRCFETPRGVEWLDEAGAYDLYMAIAELTTGIPAVTAGERRTVVGIRGAYPGTFAWHGNSPNVFNDTLVLLWADDDGKHVREYPVNTDTGSYNFGTASSSSLRPNRRYTHQNGWHRSYNALSVAEWGYHSIDDSNHNGHWDSDRNGWLGPDSGTDYERVGSGHNIHMASVDAPLGTATVDNWSAGCQTIPGMDNWTAFITDTWEREGTEVQYFLIDARDIDPEVWEPCAAYDGSHACPFRIDSFPFEDSRSTASGGFELFDVYNCSDTDEGGAEFVYLFTTDDHGTLSVEVDCDEPVDIDIHLLEGDDPDACLARDHTDFDYEITPGRYLIVADTWVDEGGTAQSGAFTLRVELR